MKRVLVLATLLLAGPASAAPSFDCGKARSKAEKAICASAEASARDADVAEAYRLALSRLEGDADAVARLKADQKTFVAYRDTFIDNENLVLPDFLARRRDFLLSIDPTVRDGVEGRWRSFWGETRIGRTPRGMVEFSFWLSQPILRSWNCGDPKETAPGRMVRGALVSGRKDDGMRFERRGRLLIISIVSEPGVESDASCGYVGKDTNAMFPVMSAQPVVAEQRPAARPADKDLAEILPRLPAAAFDNTTDGIADAELRRLVATGSSENWSLRIASPQKMVASARQAAAEVYLTRKTLDGTDLIEVLTFNEKAVTYAYWALSPAGKLLVPHTPQPRTRLFNEGEDGHDAIAPGDLPAPLRAYVDKLEQCQHWEGETSDDLTPERKREILQQLKKLGCASRAGDEKNLKAQFKDQPRWLGVIARVSRLFAP